MDGLAASLSALDRSGVLLAQSARHPALDAVMIALGDPWALVVPLALLALLTLGAAAKRDVDRAAALGAITTFAAALVAFGCADGLGHVAKLATARPRPCHAIAELRTLVGCGDSYSFPSNHAANAFAVAAVLAHRVPRWRWVWFAVAALLAYARVHVGAHYPSDAIAGAALGLAVGACVVAAVPRIVPRLRLAVPLGSSGWRSG
jgi:undecaprenyl-diphosphatase